MAVNTQAIYGVVQREAMERGFWTRIGTAFQNHDGSWNLRFDYLPTDRTATVQMRQAKASEEVAERGSAAEESSRS